MAYVFKRTISKNTFSSMLFFRAQTFFRIFKHFKKLRLVDLQRISIYQRSLGISHTIATFNKFPLNPLSLYLQAVIYMHGDPVRVTLWSGHVSRRGAFQIFFPRRFPRWTSIISRSLRDCPISRSAIQKRQGRPGDLAHRRIASVH